MVQENGKKRNRNRNKNKNKGQNQGHGQQEPSQAEAAAAPTQPAKEATPEPAKAKEPTPPPPKKEASPVNNEVPKAKATSQADAMDQLLKNLAQEKVVHNFAALQKAELEYALSKLNAKAATTSTSKANNSHANPKAKKAPSVAKKVAVEEDLDDDEVYLMNLGLRT